MSIIQTSQRRNQFGLANLEFVMHGIDKVFLVHKPNFHISNLRRQVILEIDLPYEAGSWYRSLRQQYPDSVLTFTTHVDLTEVLKGDLELLGFMKSNRTSVYSTHPLHLQN